VRTAIIVINKNDPGIVQTLSALSQLRQVLAEEAEIVVVDASEGRFDESRDRFPKVRWIPFAPIPGRPSIPHQRNVGVAQTTQDLVVFIDASCVPGPDWLEQLCAPIVAGEETIVAGRHRSTTGQSYRDLAADRLEGRRYLTEAMTINLAIARSVLTQLGGFDESFRYGSDVDLSWRAIDAGHRIRYAPEAYVTHDWGDMRAETKRSLAYGRARAHLYLKHPNRWRGLLGPDSPVLVYPLLLVMLPLMFRRPRTLLVLLIPLIRNRGRQPVSALVEHLIYGAGAWRAVGDWIRTRR
jgi:GT2 family glycosyltransferase